MPIDTGYRPEFGLGALYQGFNAANSEATDAQSLIKQFLANQREQQSQPIDLAQKQLELDSGQYKRTPEYQTGMRDTISGQGMSNLAAGQSASALLPFKQRSEQARMEAEQGNNEQIQKLQEMDRYLSGVDENGQPVQMAPQVRQQLQTARDAYADRLSKSSSFFGKKNLQDEEYNWKMMLQELANKGRVDAVGAKPTTQPKFNEKQMLADLREKAVNGDEQAAKLLDAYIKQMQATGSPGWGAQAPDLSQLGNGSIPTTTPTQNAPTFSKTKPDPLGIR